MGGKWAWAMCYKFSDILKSSFLVFRNFQLNLSESIIIIILIYLFNFQLPLYFR